MNTRDRCHRPAPQSRRGVTLLELMIALAVLGIVMSIAYPSFMDSIRKGRRAEAVGAIARVQQEQERFRARFPTYATDLSAAPTASSPGLGIPATTANGRYTLVLDNVTARDYTITATAAGNQVADVNCKKLAAKQEGGAISYGSGAATIDWTDPKNCWAK